MTGVLVESEGEWHAAKGHGSDTSGFLNAPVLLHAVAALLQPDTYSGSFIRYWYSLLSFIAYKMIPHDRPTDSKQVYVTDVIKVSM